MSRFEQPEPHVIQRLPRTSAPADNSNFAGLKPAPWTLPAVTIAIAEAVLCAIAPPRCAGCSWFSPHLFCENCAPRVPLVDQQAALCHCCGEPFDARAAIAPGTICRDCRGSNGQLASPIERARSLWMLRGPVRQAIHNFKYRRHSDLSAALGAHLGDFARRDSIFSGAGLVVPVPLHSRREWARGFNQSGLLAHHAARELGVPCVEILRRVRHTPTQTSLSRQARDANVRAAFQVLHKRKNELHKYLYRDSSSPQRPILLVDDVWTTGATLRECARALRKAGFQNVCALTLARRGTPGHR